MSKKEKNLEVFPGVPGEENIDGPLMETEVKEEPVTEEVKEEKVIEEPVKEEVKHTGTITMH